MPDMNDEDDRIALTEERLHVGKERRLTGRVQVSTRTETVESQVPVELDSVEVEVVRVPVDRRIDAAPEIVTEGDLTIIPVVEERVVVTRELFLREELHVRRIRHRETTEIPVSTRRQVAHVERLPAADPSNPETKEDHDEL